MTVWRRSATRARRPASPPDSALDPQNPFALILKNSRGAAILHALNPAARRAGLRRGQTQADARAMIPQLICKPADPEADARALTALAVWAELAMDVIDYDLEQAKQSGLLRRSTMSLGLSLADRACLTLAARLGATAVTADRAWVRQDLGIAVELVR